MSVTFKPVILDHLWKDDKTNFIRVRITHKRKTRYIKSNIIVSKDDLGRGGSIKSISVQNSVDDLMKKIRNVVNDMDMYEIESMDVDGVLEGINAALKQQEKFRLDFIEYGMKVAERKSKGNASTYYVALNALLRFFKERHPDISEITVRNLRGFEVFITNEKVVKVNRITGERKTLKKSKGGRAASLYLSNIRHIYKCARMEFNDPDLGLFPIPNDPFEYYSLPKPPASTHKNIPRETVQLMIDSRKSLKGRQRMAIDAYLMSFGLCGMNQADMYTCLKPRKGDILNYRRTKTTKRRDDKAEMFVKIHPVIKNILADYAGKERCFNYYETYSRRDTFSTALNVELRRWAENHKVDTFTFASARHTWGSIGRSKLCKIDGKVITAGLCHVDESSRVDDIYVNFDWELLWEAQKKILDVFDWE